MSARRSPARLLAHPLGERLALGVAVTAFYLLYVPLSRMPPEGPLHQPVTALDRALPLDPRWMYVYAAVLVTAFLPALAVAHRLLFRRVCLAYALVQAAAFGIFRLWPVEVALRPARVEPTSFARWGLALTYLVDRPGSCFPSLHVTMAVLAALCTWKVDRPVGALGALLGLCIATSTLMVKQHYLADVPAGFALATVAWALLVRPWRPPAGDLARLRSPRWAPALLIPAYLAVVAALYVLYRLELPPALFQTPT